MSAERPPADDVEPGALPRHLRRDTILLVLTGAFLLALVVANVFAASKIIVVPLGFHTVYQAVGIIAYPVTFLVTDLISELYGKDVANRTVWTGFVMSLGLVVFVEIGRAIPSASPEQQAVFTTFFQSTTRAVAASMLAYLVAQLIDVRLFHFWKRLTHGRHLWLRNNGSTVGSQIVDTIIVTTVLFWGAPSLRDGGQSVMSAEEILSLIRDGALFKAIVALVDTPLFYLGVHFLRPLVGPSKRQESASAGQSL